LVTFDHPDYVVLKHDLKLATEFLERRPRELLRAAGGGRRARPLLIRHGLRSMSQCLLAKHAGEFPHQLAQ
jgi:hypothetical protein